MAPLVEEDNSQHTLFRPQSLTVPAAVSAPACVLGCLAPELSHQTLDDAPVLSVLFLVSCPKPGTYLHQRVLGHLQYTQVFPCQTELAWAYNLDVLLYDTATSSHTFPLHLYVFRKGHKKPSSAGDRIVTCPTCLKIKHYRLPGTLVESVVEIPGSVSRIHRGTAFMRPRKSCSLPMYHSTAGEARHCASLCIIVGESPKPPSRESMLSKPLSSFEWSMYWSNMLQRSKDSKVLSRREDQTRTYNISTKMSCRVNPPQQETQILGRMPYSFQICCITIHSLSHWTPT